MKVEIKATGMLLPQHTHRALKARVSQAMTRVADRVRLLRVSLRDDHLDNGAADKACLLEARLANGGRVVVVRQSEHVTEGLNAGLRTLRQRLNKKAKRHLTQRTPQLQEAG